MKIIQITDLHVGKEGEETHGVDVRQNFLDILEAVKSERPDYLVISGDLCYLEGEEEVYNWIRKQLDDLDFPYFLLPGNHDDSKRLAEAFDLENDLKDNQLFYKKSLGNQTCLFLDTSTYYLPDRQLDWLEKELSTLNGDLVIFIHHPPLNANVPFMDNKHALKNMEAVQNLLFKYPHTIQLFCGHYHVDKVICQKNLNVYITPATYFQIDWRVPEFKVDHYKIGFREIEIQNGSLITAVRYL